MDLNAFSSSKYLSKTDLPAQGLTLTIASFGVETMQDQRKKPWVAFLEPGIKPMLLNKTNINRLKAILGTTQTEAMVGKRIQVYNDPMIEMQGQVVGGLRLRPLPAPPAPAPATSQEPSDEIPF